MSEHDRTGSTSDRAVFGIVVLVIGMMVLWAAIANLLGGEIGLAAAVLVGVTIATVVWRDRVTFDLLATIALVGFPVLIGGLALS